MTRTFKGISQDKPRRRDVFIIDANGNTTQLHPERSQAVANRSRRGFDWGSRGLGAGQLAVALLLEVTNNNAIALGHAQDFKTQFIVPIDRQHTEWEIPEADILAWLAERGISHSEVRTLTIKQAAAMLKNINDLYVLIDNAEDLNADTQADIITLAASILFNAVGNDPTQLQNEIDAFLQTDTREIIRRCYAVYTLMPFKGRSEIRHALDLQQAHPDLPYKVLSFPNIELRETCSEFANQFVRCLWNAQLAWLTESDIAAMVHINSYREFETWWLNEGQQAG